MLLTPLGPIKLYVNELEIEYTVISYILDKRCRDLNGRYLIRYEYKKDDNKQRIKCCLPSIDTEGEIESGERLEAISFYNYFTKLTIGMEAEFGLEEENGYDYSGSYLNNGIEYETNMNTESQILQFGVSWIRPCTGGNNHQTWYGSDPSLMPINRNKFHEVGEEVINMWDDILLKLSEEFDEKIPNFKGIAMNYFESPIKIIITRIIEEEIYLPKNQNEIITLGNEVIKRNLLPNIERKYKTYEFVF